VEHYLQCPDAPLRKHPGPSAHTDRDVTADQGHRTAATRP
jgi:hypothetical protein